MKRAAAIVAAVLLLGLTACESPYETPGPEATAASGELCEVTEKWQTQEVVDTDDSSYTETVYYIYASEPCGVMQLRDTWWLNTWSTAEAFGRIQVGSSYYFETFGERVPFLNWYPRITNITPAS